MDVINYVPLDFAMYELSLLHGWGIKRGLFFKKLPNKIIQARYGKAMRKIFDMFKANNLSFSAFCQTPDKIEAAVLPYDALVTGSDQVWHFSRPSPFFLEGGRPFKGRKISYAPCCGTPVQQQEKRALIGGWIADFDHISVRNEFSKELVNSISGREAEVVADPTLLVDLSDLEKRPRELTFDSYVLMYMLGEEIQGGHEQVLSSIKDRFGPLPVVAVVSSTHKPQRFPWADQVLYTAGPAEWLYLNSHAEFVYTDSFHGALFAVKNERPFCVYYIEKARAPRLLDLADQYNLSDFIAANARQAVKGIKRNRYDFYEQKAMIRAHSIHSLSFLKESIPSV